MTRVISSNAETSLQRYRESGWCAVGGGWYGLAREADKAVVCAST
uniref:Uncharacterized protein n=1 Tax=Anguilla anguilla TaxID=7936 RepID=A0A0E9QBF6_ANGAN